MIDAILILNVGSSSLKFAVYPDTQGASPAILRGKISRIGVQPVFSARDIAQQPVGQASLANLDSNAGADELILLLLQWIQEHGGGMNITAAGHRVVHGGRNHTKPAHVTDTLMSELEALTPLAPLHQPHNLSAIRSVAVAAPNLPQVVCFDTSFHRTTDKLAQLFALPRELSDEGIIRYGFHGLSYQYIASTLSKHLKGNADGRVIVAHLGSGASMCAIKNRLSVATTMGFTALDGLMMGRRCGKLDPGVVLYLIEEKGMSIEEITTLLYRKSGLLGVSGISNDMATLQASDADEAREAIDLFCYRAAGELASLASTIGGLDAIIFTAGIGENSALIRQCICERLQWMGVILDEGANDKHDTRISSDDSSVDVLIIPTDEESVIAEATKALT